MAPGVVAPGVVCRIPSVSSPALRHHPLSVRLAVLARRLRRRLAVMVKRSLRRAVGWVLFIVGAILAPTPIPFGLIMVAIGLYLLAKDSVVARRMIRSVRRRIPALTAALDRLHQGLDRVHPKVGKGLRAFIDRTHPDGRD